MLDLSTPIEKLTRVGSRNMPQLRKLGIHTVKDLLWHFPHRYEDYSRITPIAKLNKDEVANVQGRVVKIETQRSWKKRLTIVQAIIEDDSAATRAVWFNQPYLTESLPLESVVSLAGKVKLDKHGLYLASPSYERITTRTEQEGLTHTGRLVPIYPETSGITSKYLRFLIRPLLALDNNLLDPLPPAINQKYGFPSLGQAVKSLHFPVKKEEMELAKKRISFDELLLFQLKSIASRRKISKLKALAIPFQAENIKKLTATLPFELTADQKLSAFEILKDLEKPYPMNRLLNGDVGSGKTIVALLAAYAAARHGCQTVFLAPTEILAQQHYATIKSLLNVKLKAKSEKEEISIGLLTGNEAKQWPVDEITNEEISKKLMREKIAHGEIKIVIGTHAVIQKEVRFKDLALVVIDEQHRFGVEQRKALMNQESEIRNQEKESPITHDSKFIIPHLLSMTATPIPRTLALTIYGDLDISLIKEKPYNRKKIVTKVINQTVKQKAYEFIDEEINKGRQVFVICPKIDPADQALSNKLYAISKAKNKNQESLPLKTYSLKQQIWAEVKAVTEEYEKLTKTVFPHRRIAMLHGKMKPLEKERIMSGFKNGQYDLLVATSVVEVGIDIPNASVMLIENAERFGLAQLHQFRGRVGRAEHQSYCLLINGGSQSRSKNIEDPRFTESKSGQYENRRLKALEANDDGFALAEQDLVLRGPGEFIGTKQSGLPDLAMASLTDLDLIKKARLEAKLLLKEDPSLKKYPLLKAQLTQFQKIRHFE